MQIAIRQFEPADAQAFFEAVKESVDHVSPWLPWCNAEYSLADAREWADSAAQAWAEGTDYRFLIEETGHGRILGSVGINSIDHRHRTGNLGYWIRKSALNQGVCTRAARLAIEFAFDSLGLHRIEVRCQLDNHASNIVAGRLGGVYEGIFRNKILVNGQSLPARCYSVIPADYTDSGH